MKIETKPQPEGWTKQTWSYFKSEQYGSRLFTKLCNCASWQQWEIKSSWAYLHCQLNAAWSLLLKLIPASSPRTVFCSLVPQSLGAQGTQCGATSPLILRPSVAYIYSKNGILKLQTMRGIALNKTSTNVSIGLQWRLQPGPFEDAAPWGLAENAALHSLMQLEQQSLQKGLWHDTAAF